MEGDARTRHPPQKHESAFRLHQARRSRIAHADYAHDVEYSPTKSLLDAYLDQGMPYEEYFKKYAAELEADNAIPDFFKKYGSYDSIAIVGTATKKRHSHAEELLKLLKEYDPSITS